MGKQVNLLVIGEGGREFAIAKQLQASSYVNQVYCAPGNIGMATVGVQTVDIDKNDFRGLIDFAKSHHIAWTFVGPEDCLVNGIVDEFNAAGLNAFGPNKRAAQLEGSKEYALNFMEKYHIPTAKHVSYTSKQAAINQVDQFGFPLVIKKDGLAGGKGVAIAQHHNEAVDIINEMFNDDQSRLILEECLVGPEYSMFVLVSGDEYQILPMAQDHKRAYDNDKGPNTGGMGAYSPLPQLKESDRQQMIDEVVKPSVEGLTRGGFDYHGILYIGLILTVNGPKVIEYNVRLGDPETQVVLPRLKTDLFELVDASLNNRKLPRIIEDPHACFGVVLAAEGYPKDPMRGQKLGELRSDDNVQIMYANVGGKLNDLVGDGGRLLMVTAKSSSLQVAHDKVYSYLKELDEPHCFYRTDIGAKAGL